MSLAFHPEGLVLVRIGKTSTPEFVAWRYGRELKRRRWQFFGGVVRDGLEYRQARRQDVWRALRADAPPLLLGWSLFALQGWLPPLGYVGAGVLVFTAMRTKARVESGAAVRQLMSMRLAKPLGSVTASDGKPLLLHAGQAHQARLEPGSSGFAWGVRLPRFQDGQLESKPSLVVWGHEAERALRLTLPVVANRDGAGSSGVRAAIRLLEDAGGPLGYFAAATDEARRRGLRFSSLDQLPRRMRLALEIAANEEREQKALEGELWRLEQEWREAEEVAAISDSLLVPEWVEQFLAKHRPEVGSEPSGPVRA